MANSNSPTGLGPVFQNAGDFTGQFRLAAVPAAQTGNIFVGDPLVALGGTDAFGVPLVGIATAGAANAILGCMIGVTNGPSGSGSTLTRDLPVYRQASILNYIQIFDDPNGLFVIQEDSVGGAIAASAAGFANGNLVAGAGGSTTTGRSSWMLQSSSVSSSANTTYQVKLIGLVRGPDNAIGNYAKWLVRLNNPQLWSTTGV